MTRFVFALAGAALLLVLAGCSLHRPQPVTLPVDLPQQFSAETSLPLPIDRWWEMFDDERLNALMEEAFAANLDISQAIARLQQLEATSRSIGAARRPSLNLQGQASRESTPGFFGNNEGDSYRLSLAAAFEVDLWNKLKSRRDAARLEKDASRAEVLSLYLGLSAQVADQYYLAAEQRHQLGLTRRTVEAHADTLERVRRRYRQGLVPALDLYQARQNLAAAKARLPVFEAGLARAEHALSVLLGRYPQKLESAEVVSLRSVPDAFGAGLPSELLNRRPDVRAAFLRVKASDKRIAAAIADRFPSLNLAASYGDMSSAFSTGDITGTFW
ncbi:MAG: efflux transporter outer membrane subunit, partial [Desulfuromonadales bacterium]|nr:efflux transporter outer membrane subunit [Desulfuromonadales bacterium]NIS42824.1 efflux transporter outer membrane subunit [Desulfuromonadales bacterium]